MDDRKIALVTEAENGLAYRLAGILREKGYEVIIAAQTTAYNDLRTKDLKGMRLLEMDVTTTSGITQLYAYIKTVYGKLDVLINNAEIANGFGQKLTELDITQVRKLYDRNFFSVLQLTQKLYPLLRKGHSSRIINSTSGLGNLSKMGNEDFCYSNYKMTAYSTAKAALEMLTLLLSKEFEGTNVTISGFDPIRLKNCTHNSVKLSSEVEHELLELLETQTHFETI